MNILKTVTTALLLGVLCVPLAVAKASSHAQVASKPHRGVACFWDEPGLLHTLNLSAVQSLKVVNNPTRLIVYFGYREGVSIETPHAVSYYNSILARVKECNGED